MIKLPDLRYLLVVMCFVDGLWGHAQARAEVEVSPTLAGYLQQGRLKAASGDITDKLNADPKNSQARFALGVVKFLIAIEQLGQSQYAAGAVNDRLQAIPVLRLPTPDNPVAGEITYAELRQIIADFQERILVAEADLALEPVSKPL